MVRRRMPFQASLEDFRYFLAVQSQMERRLRNLAAQIVETFYTARSIAEHRGLGIQALPFTPRSPILKLSKPTPKKSQPRKAVPMAKARAKLAPSRAPKGIELPEAIVSHWQETVLALSRLPRGTARDQTPQARLNLIMRQEAPAVADLWATFTQDRDELSRHLLSGRRRTVAYLLGFHLANAARMQALLERADTRHGLNAWLRSHNGRLRLHDLGCGTGALAQTIATFAGRAGIASEHLDVNLIDLNAGLLSAAQDILQHMPWSVRAHKTPLEKIPLDRFIHNDASTASIYSLGYVWNETERNPAARARLRRLFAGAVERKEKALLAILEPASQLQCRSAMELRDTLVADGWVPLYPCPMATACPMLERARDWCYSEAIWRQPQAMAWLDQRLQLDRARFSSTMMLFATPTVMPRLKPPVSRAVVVGRPEQVSAKSKMSNPKAKAFDYLLCLGKELKKNPATPGKNFLLRGTDLNA